jgi:hypothetical protein
MRYFVRKAPGGWMVWDRSRGGPAKIGEGYAVNMFQVEAELLSAMLSEGLGELEPHTDSHELKH